MTKVITAVKNSSSTIKAFIREKFSSIFNIQSRNGQSVKDIIVPDSKKIIRSKNLRGDEYGYLKGMESL
jgi:regulator of extracellular matrix RemA (YlzA/DUF370 family)